jgi:hypothetical protein
MSRRRHPDLVRQAVCAIAAHGHCVDVDLSGTHYKIYWAINGRRHLLVISKTSSDHRAQANSRATLRRLLRGDWTEIPQAPGGSLPTHPLSPSDGT